MAEPYPLEWPSHIKRTTYRKVGPYRVSLAKAREDLYKELELFGVSKVVVSSDARLRLDGKLAAQQSPLRDNGVAVYFSRNSERYVIACDKWMHVQDNVRAIGLTIQAMRAIERHGTAGMVTAALEGYKAIPAQTGRPWYEVIGVPETASRHELDTVFRIAVKQVHPDLVGYESSQYLELLEAYRAGRLATTGQESPARFNYPNLDNPA